MKHLFISIVMTCMLSVAAFAQYYSSGNVTLEPGISELLQAHVNGNMRKTTVEGYRIQLIQHTNRDNVRAQKTKLLTRFPHLRAYETYDSPFFRLRVGDFKTRLDAYKVYSQIKSSFRNAFIAPDQVNVSEL